MVVWVGAILSVSFQPAGACAWCFPLSAHDRIQDKLIGLSHTPNQYIRMYNDKTGHLYLYRALNTKPLNFNHKVIDTVNGQESLKDNTGLLYSNLDFIFVFLAIIPVTTDNIVLTNRGCVKLCC